jgi:hypothetical protein
MFFQTCWSMLISSVEPFSNRLKNVKDTTNDNSIIITLLRSLDVLDVPTIMGNNGRTQGARTVSMPAKNEVINRIILIYLLTECYNIIQRSKT